MVKPINCVRKRANKYKNSLVIDENLKGLHHLTIESQCFTDTKYVQKKCIVSTSTAKNFLMINKIYQPAIMTDLIPSARAAFIGQPMTKVPTKLN